MLHYRPNVQRCLSNIISESINTAPRRILAPTAGLSSSAARQNARLYSTDGGSGGVAVRKERRHRPDRPQIGAETTEEPKQFKIRRGTEREDGEGIAPRKIFSIKFTDPLQLAQSTLAKLKREKFEEAVELVRKNSATLECTVSWNHLIDYQCKMRKINGAIKTYNEMKKRGQIPDAYTYTIIFRGLASQAITHPSAVANALSIYHSMDSPKSPVAPNPIHTNAVLTVCAKAEDLDAMFGVAAKLKDMGSRAPNSQTYTIMFNAMLNFMKKNAEKLTAEEFQVARSQCVMDARRMWQDIVKRWRHGDLWIDEELVCSLGRILVFGGPADKNDIPAMLRQTMRIPQLLMRNEKEIVARTVQPVIAKPKVEVEEEAEDLEEWEGKVIEHKMAEVVAQPVVLEDQFRPITPPKRQDTTRKGLSSYAVPSKNTLDLLVEAFPDPKFSTAAMLYWKILTQIYEIQPDTANYHSYLRILRMARLSDEAANVVSQMPDNCLEPATFKIAMAACVRDKTNTNAFRNAGRIIDILTKHSNKPDYAILHSYLDVALDTSADTDPDRFRIASRHVTKPAVVEGMKNALSEAGLQNLHPYLTRLTTPPKPVSNAPLTPEKQREAKAAHGKRIVSALAKCQPAMEDIMRGNFLNRKGGDPEKKAMAIKLCQRMISAYDQLIEKGMAPRDKFRELREQQKKLAAVVTVESNKYVPDAWIKMRHASFKTWKKGGMEGLKPEVKTEEIKAEKEVLEEEKKNEEPAW